MSTPPVITPKITARVVSHDVLGPSSIAFCPASLTVDGAKVSATSRPDYATAPEAWHDIGRGSNFQPAAEEKMIEIEECQQNGAWMKHKESMLQSFSFTFTTSQTSPEALQLAFGLGSPIKDGEEMPLANAGSNCIEGWLRIVIKRSQDGTDKVQELYGYGRLKLKTAPSFTSDFIKPEFEFLVDPGVEMATITFANVQAIAASA